MEVPAGDLYFLKWILHDWDDASCICILLNIKKAMLPGAKIMVFEMLVENGNLQTSLMDINMLSLTKGNERTLSQFKDLFEKSGLRFLKLIRMACPLVCLEVTL